MQETQPSIFDETDVFMLPPRRALLPWWIIFFSRIFIVLCSLEIVLKLIEYFGPGNIDLSMFGIVPKTEIPIKEFIALPNSILSIIAAYGLLKEKDWAINIAITNGLISAVESFFTPSEASAEGFPAAIFWIIYIVQWVILIAYLWKLFVIRKDWSIRSPRGPQL